jgi:hypothetical protein
MEQSTMSRRRRRNVRIMPMKVSILLFLGLLANKLAYDRKIFLYQGEASEGSMSLSATLLTEAEPAFWLPTRTKHVLPNSQDKRSSTLAATIERHTRVGGGQSTRTTNNDTINGHIIRIGYVTRQNVTTSSASTSIVKHQRTRRHRRRPRHDNKYSRTQLVSKSERRNQPLRKDNADIGTLIPRSRTNVTTRAKSINLIRNSGTTVGKHHWKVDVDYDVPETPGAYIHIGKTGGSTISSQLRNGCHSWLKKPCGAIPDNESHVSLLTTYYHTPDFDKLSNRSHDFYVIGLRDPFDRLLSTYAYQHPRNIRRRNDAAIVKGIRYFVAMYSCFPTLERFAELVGTEPTLYEYPNASEMNRTNCTNLAKAVINQRVRFSDHFYWSMKRIHGLLGSQMNSSTIFAVRNENLWGDWVSTNEYIGQNNVSTPNIRVRDHRNMKLPVPKKVSIAGRRNLCIALKPDYDAYLDFLRLAKNLDETERASSLKVANRNCPWLKLSI